MVYAVWCMGNLGGSRISRHSAMIMIGGGRWSMVTIKFKAPATQKSITEY